MKDYIIDVFKRNFHLYSFGLNDWSFGVHLLFLFLVLSLILHLSCLATIASGGISCSDLRSGGYPSVLVFVFYFFSFRL